MLVGVSNAAFKFFLDSKLQYVAMPKDKCTIPTKNNIEYQYCPVKYRTNPIG